MKHFLFSFFSILLGTFSAQALELAVPPVPFPETELPAGAEPAKPQISPTGVDCGTKTLQIRNNVLLEATILTLNAYGKPIFNADVRGVPSVPSWAPYVFKNSEFDEASRTITRRREFQLTEKDSGNFTQTVRLKEDGKIEMKFLWDCDFGILREGILTFHLPSILLFGKTFEADGQTVTFPPEPVGVNWKRFQELRTLTFFPNEPKNRFSLTFPEGASLRFDVDSQITHVVVSARKPCLTVELDPGKCFRMPQTDCIVGGVNFTQSNAFRVSVFPTRNVLMNPSFESGSRYWKGGANSLTDSDAHSGRFAFQFRNPPKPLEGISLQSVGTVITPGKTYVLSFWVKSPNGQNPKISLSVSGSGERLPMKWNLPCPAPHDQWQRVSTTFRTEKISTILLGLRAEDGVLIDDVQLEPADEPAEPTAFAGNPLGLELKTAGPLSPVADAAQPMNAVLTVRATQPVKGALSVRITDFFGRQTFQKNFPIQLSAAKSASDELSIPLSDDLFPRGTNVLEVTARLEGFPEFTDFLRLVRIPFAANTARHKNLQSIPLGFAPFAVLPDQTKALWRACGIGAVSYQGDWQRGRMSQAFFDEMAKYGVEELSGGNVIFSKNWKPELNDLPFEWNGQSVPEMETYPPEFLAWVEKNTYELVRKNPWVPYWSLATEPMGAFAPLKRGDYAEYAKLVFAFWRGLTKANPDVPLNPFGECNLFLQGRTHVLDFLRTARKLDPSVRFRVIDVHSYRPFPESPDVEEDLLAFMKGLAEIGYPDIKIKIGEGSYYYPMIAPECGLAPWAGVGPKDQYSTLGIPSYDLGWGERIGTAQTLRESLVYFKHADRVINHSCWCPYRIDSVTPVSWLAMNAALTELLGNASFRKDVRFAPGARAYVFEDENQRPVAAVWQFEETFDRGLTSAKTMRLKLAGKVEFLDLMGNVCSVPEKKDAYVLPLCGFPFFVRTEPGTLPALVQALSDARIPEAAPQLPLILSMELLSPERVRLSVTNPLSRPVTAEIRMNGAADPQKLAMKPVSTQTFDVPLPEKITAGEFCQVRLPVRIRCLDREFERTFTTRAAAIPYVSEEFHWNDVPILPLKEVYGKADAQGTCQLAWNEKNFYVRVETDPVETVQLFFDGFGDSRAKFQQGVAGLDPNDFCYELRPHEVFRLLAPDHQLTGGAGVGFVSNTPEPAVSYSLTTRNGRQIYEAAFPARCLQPIPLEEGSVKPGLGLFLRSGKNARSNVPAPYGKDRPDQFPQLLLVR